MKMKNSHPEKESKLIEGLKGIGIGFASGIIYGTFGNFIIPTSLVEIHDGIREYKEHKSVEGFYNQATKIPLALAGHIYTLSHLTNHLINRDWGNINVLDILLLTSNLFSLYGEYREEKKH